MHIAGKIFLGLGVLMLIGGGIMTFGGSSSLEDVGEWDVEEMSDFSGVAGTTEYTFSGEEMLVMIRDDVRCDELTFSMTNDTGENHVWIDCEDTFKPRRLIQMLVARNEITEEEAKSKLDQITYLYTPNTEQLLGTINGLSKLLLEKKPKLVILDGAIGQFREEYLGRGTLAERQMQIARLMTHIKNISFYFRCPVVFTNQVQSDPSMMFGDPIKPIGGNVVAHASTYRLYFKKSGKKRLARMIDSPEHAQADAEYILTDKGLVNVE